MTGSQALKRIPRIKFPQRRPNPSGTVSEPKSSSAAPSVQTFFSNSKVSTSMGGKASLQPKRTVVSQEEIEAILVSQILFLVRT
ncbi:hypothetical protein BT93_E0602 [Corymbia citriodora subsp. variegata]|nr:hypothetical protein BT93_E0602 [Corymbia citriodora subsp. variegata]